MYIKLSKAAKLLDVHRDTLRRYLRYGILSGSQLPTGHWRIDEASVKALLDKPIDQEIDDLIASL